MITNKQEVTPSTPAATYNRLYAKSDGKYYFMAPDGVEHQVASADAATAISVALALALG